MGIGQEELCTALYLVTAIASSNFHGERHVLYQDYTPLFFSRFFDPSSHGAIAMTHGI